MKLSTTLRETVLRDSRVVAGARGLERQISWVHMVDHPEVVQWTRPGQLLLTTGYHWPKSPDLLANFVRELAQAGLAGIVLAVPHFLDRVPPAVIEQADALEFPVLELPWEIPFSEVTQELLEKIIRFQTKTIEQSELIHRALTNAAVAAQSLQDIADALEQLLERKVYFTLEDGTVLTRNAANLAPSLALRGTLAIDDISSRAQRHWIETPVRISSEIAARLWIEGPPDEEGLLRRAAEHAAVISALHLAHQRALVSQETRLGQALVSSLLDAQFTPNPANLERARIAGWDELTDYRVCLLLLNEPTPLSDEGLKRRDEWSRRVHDLLLHRGYPALLSATLNHVRFIIPAAADQRGLWQVLRDEKCALAVSRVHKGTAGIAQGARDVQSLIPRLRPGQLHDFREAALSQALMGGESARRAMVELLIAPLETARGGVAFLETLGALADEGFQLANAAKNLGIHISTLRYRMQKMEALMGISFESPDARFSAQVALVLHRLEQDGAI